MTASDIGIIGMGYRVPGAIRTNNDPIFDWLHAHHTEGDDLFTGYKTRHVLSEGESVVDILTPAAHMAIDDAELDPGDIDLVIGCVSPSTYIVPSDLFLVTQRLKLPERTQTIPLANDFTNFNVALELADAMVRAGRARHVLIAIGGGWTRAVDYHTPQAVTAADGAAAAVVARTLPHRPPRWQLVDVEVFAQEANFGDMYLIGDRRQVRPDPGAGEGPQSEDWSGPYFHITEKGRKDFSSFGGETALIAVKRLLQRQGIAASDITFTGHQASQALLDLWRKALAPGAMFQTIAELANMTVANIPVNLCRLQNAVTTPWVVALGLAPDMHAHALLLRPPR